MAKTALEMGSQSEPIRLAIKDGLNRLRTMVAQGLHEGQTLGEITTLNRDNRPIEAFLTVIIDEILKP